MWLVDLAECIVVEWAKVDVIEHDVEAELLLVVVLVVEVA